MDICQKIGVVIVGIVALASCAPYTNQELRNIFNTKGFETVERQQGIVVFLPGIFFEVDKANLTDLAQLKIGEMATVVNDARVVDRNLLVEGHTDSTASDAYNLDLSERRAQVVYQGLVARQVNPKRLTSRGFGEKYPIADNTKPDGTPNPDGQARNRRVEVIVKNIE